MVRDLPAEGYATMDGGQRRCPVWQGGTLATSVTDVQDHDQKASMHYDMERQPPGVEHVAGRGQGSAQGARQHLNGGQMFWLTPAHANARDDLGLRERNGVYLVGVVHLQDRDVSLGRRWGRQHLGRRAGAAV